MECNLFKEFSGTIANSGDSLPVSPKAKSQFAYNGCFTKVEVVRFNYIWTINNFSICCDMDEDLKSSKFSTGAKDVWYLNIYLKENKEYLGLFLKLDSHSNTSCKLKFTFSILNAKREQCNTMESQAVFISITSGHGCHQFIKRDFLLDDANGLLPENKLSIFCEMIMIGNTINISDKSSSIERNNFQFKELVYDLANILENKTLSDVTLAVDGREFQAHKAILAARSVVFAAMFEHKMEEREENRVVITDVDRDVFKEMLGYIYTGQAPNLDNFAMELLAASDKYALEKLKKMCGEALGAELTVETVSETLILADLHSAEHLKTKAISFINANATDVIKTEGWKNMIKTHSHLIVEAFQSFVT